MVGGENSSDLGDTEPSDLFSIGEHSADNIWVSGQPPGDVSN